MKATLSVLDATSFATNPSQFVRRESLMLRTDSGTAALQDNVHASSAAVSQRNAQKLHFLKKLEGA